MQTSTTRSMHTPMHTPSVGNVPRSKAFTHADPSTTTVRPQNNKPLGTLQCCQPLYTVWYVGAA
jgi:hypothetical protein